MSLEIWLEGGDVSAGFDEVFTIALPNGSVVTFGASGDPLTYTIVDFFGVTTSGSVSLGDGPTIEIFHGVVPTDNGGFRIVFGSGFPSAGALYQVELDSNFALVGSVEQIADSYSGSADIELLPDGGMAVLYNQRDEFGVRDIGLQIFGADGTAGNRELANSNASANILHPRIAFNDEVIFTVWFDRDTGASRGRIFDLAGTAQGTAFDISTSLAGEERNFITYVEALSNGTFIAIFVNRDVNFETGNTFARLFDSSGVPLGDDIAIVPPSDAAQFPTGVTALDDGGFLLAWAENGQDGTQQRLIAQYDNDAQAVTDPFELPGFDGSVVSISVLPDGRFVVSDTGLDPSFVIVDGRMGNFDGDDNDNILVGSTTSPSTVNGFGGNDQLFGSDQDDTFFGGDGDDILIGGDGFDQLFLGTGTDRAFGGNGDDFVQYLAQNELSAGDFFDGGEGMDTLSFGPSFFDRFDREVDVRAITFINVERLSLPFTEVFEVQITLDQLSQLNEITGLVQVVLSEGGVVPIGQLGFGINVSLSDFGNVFDTRGTNSSGSFTVRGGNGNDEIYIINPFAFVRGGGGDDFISGSTDRDDLTGGNGADTIVGNGGFDTIDGGSNVDTVIYSGALSDYTITQTSLGAFSIEGSAGTDTLTTIEFLQFDDQTVRLLRGEGITVDFETADPTSYAQAVTGLRDFDGNDLGGDGSWLRIGSADVNGDGDIDQILVNDAIGRFATVGTAQDGLVYFDDHSWAGETRVAGIYIDPFVANGSVEQGSEFDSQARFQNDLQIENINRVLGSNDYNGDGVWEVYLALTDGTAFLQALMHADGNIRFANYQSEEQVRDYLTANGFGEETFGDWFGGGESSQSAQGEKVEANALLPLAPLDPLIGSGDNSLEAASMWQGSHTEFPSEFFG